MLFYTEYMRSIWRTLDAALLRDIATVAAGALVIGASFGAMAVAAGLDWWMPSLMSLLVFAGGSQFLAVGVLAAGGGVVAAVLGGLVLNARHLPFGLAVGDVFGSHPLAKIVGSHLLIDETTAFSMAQPDPRRARAAYWGCGVALFFTWNLGTALGAAAGQVIGDPGALGLDAAFPAALLALVLPSLRERTTLRAALAGAAIALATTPFVPGGIPVLLAVAGLLVVLPARSPTTEVGGVR